MRSYGAVYHGIGILNFPRLLGFADIILTGKVPHYHLPRLWRQ